MHEGLRSELSQTLRSAVEPNLKDDTSLWAASYASHPLDVKGLESNLLRSKSSRLRSCHCCKVPFGLVCGERGAGGARRERQPRCRARRVKPFDQTHLNLPVVVADLVEPLGLVVFDDPPVIEPPLLSVPWTPQHPDLTALWLGLVLFFQRLFFPFFGALWSPRDLNLLPPFLLLLLPLARTGASLPSFAFRLRGAPPRPARQLDLLGVYALLLRTPTLFVEVLRELLRVTPGAPREGVSALGASLRGVGTLGSRRRLEEVQGASLPALGGPRHRRTPASASAAPLYFL
mmetsp:Transcript_1859/g.6273  ORF Transcript_1859/g.6273 Transcript_1859/m.6273 type:complete len:289 (-) Transcript_1859:50-916(-)